MGSGSGGRVGGRGRLRGGLEEARELAAPRGLVVLVHHDDGEAVGERAAHLMT